jgi:hypothetical protein
MAVFQELPQFFLYGIEGKRCAATPFFFPHAGA